MRLKMGYCGVAPTRAVRYITLLTAQVQEIIEITKRLPSEKVAQVLEFARRLEQAPLSTDLSQLDANAIAFQEPTQEGFDSPDNDKCKMLDGQCSMFSPKSACRLAASLAG